MNTCPTEEQIFGYLEHQLPTSMREQVEEHINECEICRMLVVSLAQSASAAANTQKKSAPVGFADDATIDNRNFAGFGTERTWDDALPQPAFTNNVDPWIGKQIGPWQLLERIGEGGFGAVYRAWNPETRALFAIKILQVKSSDYREALSRFRREAQILARLHHPNIVKVKDFGALTTTGDYYIVMEHLRGHTLQEAIESAEFFPLDRVHHLIQQMCAALGHLHDAGMVHRDIKPANIFLSTEGIKILDLGLASMFEEHDLTMTGVCLGSPVYMSPEQAAGQAHHATASSDLYSLAIILFELLTGVRPFHGRTRRVLMEQHIYAHPPSLSHRCPTLPWAPALEAFFARALAKASAARFPSVAVFWVTLENAFQQQLQLENNQSL